MADKFIQMAQRNAGNTDWDNLFPLGKFETAGGTATVITLTIPNLVDGVSKTFIASASNNSAATTINGKNLYKPNTTTAPTLIAGKAYTIWYSASNDCFFIKASATGTVTPDKVLAGETYSTEDDTDLVGTMDLKAENIREGVTYGGVLGTLDIESLGGKKWASGSNTLDSSGNASIAIPFHPSIIRFSAISNYDSKQHTYVSGSLYDDIIYQVKPEYYTAVITYQNGMYNIGINLVSTNIDWIAIE